VKGWSRSNQIAQYILPPVDRFKNNVTIGRLVPSLKGALETPLLLPTPFKEDVPQGILPSFKPGLRKSLRRSVPRRRPRNRNTSKKLMLRSS
jgi:hypothetical protein